MKNVECDTTMQANKIFGEWFNERARVRYDDPGKQLRAEEEDNFVMWLLIADNPQAATGIMNNPELLRTDAIEELMRNTMTDPAVQALYELCPDYLENRTQMVDFYRNKIVAKTAYGGTWLDQLQALVL